MLIRFNQLPILPGNILLDAEDPTHVVVFNGTKVLRENRDFTITEKDKPDELKIQSSVGYPVQMEMRKRNPKPNSLFINSVLADAATDNKELIELINNLKFHNGIIINNHSKGRELINQEMINVNNEEIQAQSQTCINLIDIFLTNHEGLFVDFLTTLKRFYI